MSFQYQTRASIPLAAGPGAVLLAPVCDMQRSKSAPHTLGAEKAAPISQQCFALQRLKQLSAG